MCCVICKEVGNNWYKGKYDKEPKVTVQNHKLSVHGRNTSYKYLGESLSLSGEDPEQICEIIEEYEDLLSKVSKCDLPLALKASAFNNIALAKILHFYNSRLSEEQLDHMDATLTKIIRQLYGLYETTTQLVIYLPRDHGGIGIK